MCRLPLALLLVLSARAQAQSVVQGRVVSTDSMRIAGARVAISDSARADNYSAVTDSAGRFRIRLAYPLQPGLFFLRVEMLGYRTLEAIPLRLADRDEFTVRLTMAIDAIPLQPLHVTTRGRYSRSHLDEFYDRADRVRKFGGGLIIDYNQLRNRRGSSVQLVVTERVPAIRNCPPTYFIDGMRANAEDVRAVPVIDVEGIEIYRMPGQVPVRYQNRSVCGAVLIWTGIGDRGEGAPLTWRRIAMVLGIVTIGVLVLRW
jgi:hypothetical protein